jgi:hypothetical protein
MKKQLTFHDKTIDIALSDAAIDQSKKLGSQLLVEIQIYFSCMLGKRLAFYADQPMDGTWQVEQEQFDGLLDSAQSLADNIYLRFNPVMTKSCSVSDYIGPPPVTDFEIRNKTPYVPCWLKIDYRNGLWSGEYGWHNTDVTVSNTKQVRGDAIRNQSGPVT